MTTNKPEFPIAADQIAPDDPKPQRARQEVAPIDPNKLPALPFYSRHPEWKPPPWRRGQLRHRARRIREGL
jgi:hypothetical protein